MKGYIRKRANKWSYTVDIGKDPRTGKRKQKTQSGFKTKKEAQAALAELVTNVDKGTHFEPSKKKMKEFSLEYMEKVYKNKVKATSYDATETILLTHIVTWFGDVILSDVDQFLVHEFYAEKVKEGFSSAYIRRMHEVVRMLLRAAYKWELIKKDIAGLLVPPRLEVKEMKVWTIQQINEYLKFTKHSRYHAIFFLAAYTGMRKGEILGLTWDNVDFDRKILTVQKTLYKMKGQYLLSEPKTRNSIRTIYIDDDIIRVLRKQRVKQNLEKLKHGGVYKEHNMVFAQESGEFVMPTAVNSLFNRYINQLKFPHIRFHDLRHTHATILLQMDVNPKIVSERLGHSSVKITLDTYSHVLPSMKKDLSEQFSKAMKSGQCVVNND